MTPYFEESFEFGIVGKILYDEDAQPYDGDTVGQIAYAKECREYYGTEGVSRDRMGEIRDGIADGTLIGLPVYVFSHSGATMRCHPFDCPWDSGQSGFVYCTVEKGLAECGTNEGALECLEAEVKLYDNLLTGNVFGYVVEDANGNHLDSCWGFYGPQDADGYCKEKMRAAAKHAVEAHRAELAEKAEWEARDVVTV